jgi:2-polyprenyl-6-hydroxyphenyl methylase/3-demethylubiquinone-9 3-methyltransferase
MSEILPRPQQDDAPGLDEYIALFAPHGGTDNPYLQHHYARYVKTKQRFLSHWDRSRGNRVLDVGAHWLHQALLYAIDGFAVTALDLPVTFGFDNVRRVADAYGITLLPNPDLERITALSQTPDDTFDVVLFTEIIEHITFNPVAMWREIYRVMKPGARIVVTTPNYYALRGNTWRWLRFLQRFGGGIDVYAILTQHTYAHHWKEYSLRELIYYFCALSPDFVCVHAAYPEEYAPSYMGRAAQAIVRWTERALPILRPDVYLEIELARKDKGIVIEPHW